MQFERTFAWRTAFLGAAISLVCVPAGVRAAGPDSAAAASIQQAVQRGADLFAHSSFGGVGTCEMCHSNGGRTAGKLPDGSAIPSLAGAAAAFPRYSARSQSVMTMAQQIVRCTQGALKGKPPAFGSPDMVDLETYLTSLSKGAVMGKQFD